MSKQFTHTLRLLSVATLLCWSFLSPAFSAPLHGVSLNPVLCPGTTRTVTNSKSLNSNPWDDVGLALTGLFSDNSTDSWLFAPGTTFVENTDGTARLTGTINIFGFPYPNRSFAVDITFIGQTYTPPTGSPENRTGVPTTGWYYYHWGTATLTGQGDLAGGVLTLTEHMKAFQLGIGANQAPEATDMTANGASGWFEWTIVSQPTSGAQFNPYNPGYSVGDVAIICSGPPTVCDNPCPNLSNNTISKNCVNNSVVLTGATPTGGNGSYEYIWLQSTSGCPTNVSQAIPGATGTSYTLPSTPAVATYFVRLARQAGCTTWGPLSKSNCITVNPGECSNPNPCPNLSGNTISKSCVNYTVVLSGPAPTGGNGSYEYMWLKSTYGCPTDMSQAIPGATGPSYTLPSSPSVTTYFVRCVRQAGCTTWGPGNESNCIKVNPGECSSPNPCPDITGNTISKSCVNYTVVLSGPAPTGGNGSYEYMWLKSTSGCPTDMSQAIPGATGLSYTLPSSPSVTTYFVRCARQTGCTTWGPVNESNCIKVNPGECSRPNPCPDLSGNTISKSCVNGVPVLSGPVPTGGNGSYEYMWLQSTWGCPTDMNQAIAGATGPTYTLPSPPSKTTYFVRCVRQSGCTTWGPSNESNCITVNAYECKTNTGQCFDYDVNCTRDICGSGSWKPYAMYLATKNWGNSNYFTVEWMTFEQQPDGTATLKGALRSGWWDKINVNVTFTGGTTNPPSGSPKIELCADNHTNTSGWVYYTGMYGTVQFNDDHALSISRRGPAFQVGNGGDLQDKNLFGASGWFTLSDGTQGDFNIQLSNKRACGSHNNDNNNNDLQSKISLNMNAFAEYRRTNIEWTNNSGEHNDYFAIQKLSENGNFDDLEVMSAYASTSDVRYFQTYDKAPLDGDNYYRVKLTLRDGTVKYSDIKKVTFKNLNGVNIFPNPADDHVDIDLTNYGGKNVTIYVYDQLGYQHSVNQVNNAGLAPYRVNLENANAGSYLIRIVAVGKRDVLKQVMVQK